jgi:DNA methylase
MGSFEELKTELNGICPYFTMFPLDFPFSILQRHGSENDWVLDPFSGRGTTSFASRLLGLPSIAIDSNPVAVALTEAKIVKTTPKRIVRSAIQILENKKKSKQIPEGEFWDLCFHQNVLSKLCSLRESLLEDCKSDTRKALRAIIMGALHGPRPKTKDSYFSNQCPRTYAPKPRYAVNFWKKNKLYPVNVDVLEIIRNRAQRYYNKMTDYQGTAICGDSRDKSVYEKIPCGHIIKWIITSPPYYGMRTYIPDQWLRSWFIGGKPKVDYSNEGQIRHESPELFASELGKAWRNCYKVAKVGARLVVRFGAINNRKADPRKIIKRSLKRSGWTIIMTLGAGSASSGKRQALHFSRSILPSREEFDVWAIKTD